MKAPVRVAITGAAGQIGYQLAFRIASGQMLGNDQPVILQLLEITPALDALKGVVMELDDCAFPTLDGIVATDDPNVAFKDADYALLVGARPRGPGMERKDLLEANAAIFSVQGKAMNDHANRNIKVLVVGNPANTNALIAQAAAPDLDPRNFTAMTRLDHNRAMAQMSDRIGTHHSEIQKMVIWGNHSSTQYPDIRFTEVGGVARNHIARLNDDGSLDVVTPWEDFAGVKQALQDAAIDGGEFAAARRAGDSVGLARVEIRDLSAVAVDDHGLSRHAVIHNLDPSAHAVGSHSAIAAPISWGPVVSTTGKSQLLEGPVVLAVSGGIDSSTCIGLATRALGPKRVQALLLPERRSSRPTMTSSPRSMRA